MFRNIEDLDSLVNHIKKSRSSGPICDAIFKCPGWEKNDYAAADSKKYEWKFCPWCGEKISLPNKRDDNEEEGLGEETEERLRQLMNMD